MKHTVLIANSRKRLAAITRKRFAAIMALIALCASVAFAEGESRQAEPVSLSVDDAVARSLATDFRGESARRDWLRSLAKAEEAKLRELPSVSLSAGYTRLSNVVSSVSLGTMSWELDSLDNVFSLQANLQYPVFAGFRFEESARLASLQARSKELANEMMLRAIAFETRRAYWEAYRAVKNELMLAENLELMRQNRAVTERQVAEGSALSADLLVAGMRCDQAEIDLGNATVAKEKAFLNLASLVGSASSDSASFDLVSDPADHSAPSPFAGTGTDGPALVAYAIANLCETRTAAVTLEASRAAKKIAEAPLYPTFALTGNYTYADPNSRVAFQADPWKFTGTWSLGAALSWDVGGIPANLASREAEREAIEKSVADRKRQEEVVALDVRSCLISYERTERDLALLSRMVEPAKENERVMAERVAAGSASAVDLLASEVARLRSQYAVVNREIDRKIAEADLSRACAIGPLGDSAVPPVASDGADMTGGR